MTEHLSPSPHHSPRTQRISAILIHTTESSNAAGTLAWFADPESQVSAHIVVDKDGSIHRCVPDSEKAWHAGRSSLHGEQDLNGFSLGVELVGYASQAAFPPAQLQSAARWVAEKCRAYSIPLNRIVGHDMVALPKGRKSDPGNLPWQTFLLWVAQNMLKEQ